jgi:O-antigen/teichoic acid export membrane protein
MSNTLNNKRIAKNTLLLFFRMFLTLGVSLYTSRVVLKSLGVVDYGIYSVVGGVVIMFSFLNTSMASATQRFLTFELGKNDFEQLKKVFSMSLNIHVIIAITILILAETIGLWFLNSKLNIPLERMNAANWVYQFSILSFVVTVFSVPYNAVIIAHERMNVFAYVSVIEVTLKLLIVFSLVWFGYDKLKMYAILIFIVSIVIFSIYRIYCKRNYLETKYRFIWDRTLYNILLNYAGWNLFGNIAGIAMGQGVNILLNIFFGPVINAARGIAFQVNGAINGFVSNFQIALNPQIVKSYATNDKKYMHQLIFQGSKYSFFLLLILAMPILLETELILGWWLNTVPEYTVLFCRLVIINTLIDAISGPLMTAAQATGKIKKYQAVVGGLLLLILPLSYMFLKMGFDPQITLYVSITISTIALYARLWMLRFLINISIKKFFKEVIIIIIIVAFFSVILPLGLKLKLKEGFNSFLIIGITSVFSTCISIYFIGLTKQEIQFLKTRKIALKTKHVINKYFNK